MADEESIDGLPVIAFADARSLRSWLEEQATISSGAWVRLARSGSGRASVTFLELLDAGLCFGWSESMRRRDGEETYLQRFTPRRKRGTTSARIANALPVSSRKAS